MGDELWHCFTHIYPHYTHRETIFEGQPIPLDGETTYRGRATWVHRLQAAVEGEIAVPFEQPWGSGTDP